jgi:transcriptional regulator with PAS, ATPase and Fis domain
MDNHQWVETINISAMATDSSGDVIDMNAAAAEIFKGDGGRNLMGKNLADCHSPQSNVIIERLTKKGETNVYTIEKKGKKKLIYQTPWYLPNGSVGGLVELSIVLPPEIPHFSRDE